MLSGIASYLFGSNDVESESSVDAPGKQQQDSSSPAPKQTVAAPTEAPDDVGEIQTTSTEDEWILVDRPGNQRMETSSMENLLIEHPSMSVYQHRGGRQSSVGTDSLGSEESESPGGDRQQQQRLAGRPPLHRPRVTAGSVGMLAPAEALQSMQRAQQRQHKQPMSRGKMARSNRVRQFQATTRHPRRKHFMQRPSGANNNRKQY